MVALMNGNNNNGSLNSVCSTPTLPPSANHQSFTFSNLPNTNNNVAAAALSSGRRLSTNTLEQYSPLNEDHRKTSLTSAIQKTKDGLGNLFAVDEQSPEDLIYNLFKVPNKSDAYIGKLIMVLKNHGLQESDPRLAPMMRKIREIESEKEEKTNEARDPKHWKLSKNDFKRVISESMSLIVQTMQGDLIVPAWPQFTQFIREIYEQCISLTGGTVADYIPQLARANPAHWGVAICTVDGQRHAFGDSTIPFCFQSVSKAFNYGIAASELGAEHVHQYVGQEPSGRLFNEICLDPNNKPHNPMVNSGAIIVTSLIQNKLDMADRFEHIINQYRRIAGGEYVGFNNAMFLSEANTADRNFALAYFMKENRCFPPETTSLKEALDFYFQLCSLEVTCQGAAAMAATLANGGVCPLTGDRCIGSRPCRDVLSLMNSCGMYDYSGQFAFHVGLPAKSGVSGAMIVVVPDLMGIALWSPPLDKMGNSVRGVEFCKRLVQRFNFHNYDSLVHNESPKFDPRIRVGERERAAVVSLLFAAKAGDLNTIRRMYMQQVDLEMADYDKRTALHLAACEGHFDVALFLLEVGKVKPDPKDRWHRTPLDDAREEKHISVALLLERRLRELTDKSPSSTTNAMAVPTQSAQAFASRNTLHKSSSLQTLPSQQYGHGTIPESPTEMMERRPQKQQQPALLQIHTTTDVPPECAQIDWHALDNEAPLLFTANSSSNKHQKKHNKLPLKSLQNRSTSANNSPNPQQQQRLLDSGLSSAHESVNNLLTAHGLQPSPESVAPYFCGDDAAATTNNNNDRPTFDLCLDDGQFYAKAPINSEEEQQHQQNNNNNNGRSRNRAGSDGMRFWHDQIERMQEEENNGNGNNTGNGRQNHHYHHQHQNPVNHQQQQQQQPLSADTSDGEEEEDILSKRDEENAVDDVDDALDALKKQSRNGDDQRSAEQQINQ